MSKYEQLRENVTARTAALALVAGVALTGCSRDVEYTMLTPEETTATELASAEEENNICSPTWELTNYADERGNSPRWFPEGINSINSAYSEGELNQDTVQESSDEWIGRVKHDPRLLSTTLKAFSNAEQLQAYSDVTIEDLTSEEDPNCASELAVEAVDSFRAFLLSTDAEMAIVPTDAGVNTGVDANGNVVRNAHSGVSGTDDERVALQFTYETADGSTCTVWVMGRCGQLVIQENCTPEIPEGETDDTLVCDPVTGQIITIPTDEKDNYPSGFDACDKEDDGQLPETPYQAPAEDDPGTPDVAGEGPAGQTPNEETGSIPSETPPEGTHTEEPAQDDDGGTTGEGTEENPVVTPDEEQPEAEPEPAPTNDETDNDGDGEVDEEGEDEPDPSSSPEPAEDPFGN